MKKNQFYRRLVCLNKQPFVIYSLTSIAFLLILIRLVFLQIINHEDFKRMSDENRIRLIATQPIRGNIIDRNGNILANSKLNYSLIVKPQFINKQIWSQYLSTLSQLLNINKEDLQTRYDYGVMQNQYSIQLIDNLSTEQLIKFQENQSKFLGVEIITKVIRNYPYQSLAAHALGYTSPITESEYQILSNDFVIYF